MARGGGGRGGKGASKNREPPTREVMVSKKLAWLLRHGAEKEGLQLGRGGYANLQHVLQNRNIRSLQPAPTLQEIIELVETNSKQRFSLIHISSTQQETSTSSDTPHTSATAVQPEELNSKLESDVDPGNYLIRANQGHSLQLESGAEDLLTPILIESGNLPHLVVHGTRKEHWTKIVASGGLKPMSRNHVHFATGLPKSFTSQFASAKLLPPDDAGADGDPGPEVVELPEKKHAPLVISGMRDTSTILMFLNLRQAIEDGINFYLSENGVVLSGGNKYGIIPLELFERVEDRSGNPLVEAGRLTDPK